MTKNVTWQGLLNAQVDLQRRVEQSEFAPTDRSATHAALATLGLEEGDIATRPILSRDAQGSTIDRSATAAALAALGEAPCESTITIRRKSITELIDEAPPATLFDLTTPEHLLACQQTIIGIREDNTLRMSDADLWVASFAGLLGGLVELFVGKAQIGNVMEQAGLDKSGIQSLESQHHVSYDAANSGHIKMDWQDLTGSDKKLLSSLQGEDLQNQLGEYKKAFAHNRELYEQGAFSNLNCKGHHFDSPAHDLLGAVHAIRDQIQGTCTLYSPELQQMVTVANPGRAMQGGYSVENILTALMTFFGHILSDINGSNTTAGGGAGLGFPGYSMLMNPVGIKTGAADLAREAYLEGYDFRAWMSQGLAIAIPKIMLWVWKKLTGINEVVYTRMCAIAYGVVAAVSLAKAAYGDYRINYMALFLFANNAVRDLIYWMTVEEKRRVAVHQHILEVLNQADLGQQDSDSAKTN
ncbi:hypothetical protein KUW19_14290 [Ferrimonas balearica]|uniref:hypothetical protein n=1 Tax=Ferrimonas balearica TaxID=44012 RepID=UPI001C986614|nr:hypothetical protein [Ferrimonas balearica]MBY6107635.1 hypothetical protein [Ferrimonas balearica]